MPAFYTPYLPYRTAPTHLQPAGLPYTDRGFTGQKHNDDLGLIYYNARYYLPGVGRFVSADTIVPGPANPQSLNRYAYALNNPVRYTDPSGHITNCALLGAEEDIAGCQETASFWNTTTYRGSNAIVSYLPAPPGIIPDGWRVIEANYPELFPNHASNNAPASVYIYYSFVADDAEQLLDFELVARMLIHELERGFLYNDPLYAAEVSEYWPQDLIAQAYVVVNKSRVRNQTIQEIVCSDYVADPILNPPAWGRSGTVVERAYVLALGVDQGWLRDTSFGADQFGHQDKNDSSNPYELYKDQTYLGDFAAGTWWYPTLAASRIIYPFGIVSSDPGPYWR
ncbi:MAG: RHS repeat-associated core domain-containing protein [Ardenticatenales bacterium]|nr:RHS repeat-associated core domain-containing protein [Ardenticatenales bacterium]